MKMYDNVGLVLEGGGMRGIYTAGILDFFMEKEIAFKEVIGVSAGAIHAASYLSNQKGRSKAVSLDYLNEKKYCSVYSLVTTGDLFGEEFTYHVIPEKLNIFDYEAFKNSPMKMYATVTDIETGDPEYIHLSDLKKQMDYLRASASLPLVSRIVEINGNKYLDGGMSDSIPLKKSQENGFSKNVVVLTQPKGFRKEENKVGFLMNRKYKKYPKLVECMENRHIMYNNELDYIEQQEKLGNTFIFRPNHALNVSRIEKNRNKLETAYNEGYNQAKSSYDELIAFLGKSVSHEIQSS